MPTLQADNIADIVTATQRRFGRLKWTGINLPLQRYWALPNLMRKNKMVLGDGYGYEFYVNVTGSSAARNVGLFETDNVNVPDHLKAARVPHRHTTTNYAFDLREPAINAGASRLVDVVQNRRVNSLDSLAVLVETDFWGKPSSSSDNVTPFGVKYWLVSNSSTGFNGGNASGFSDGPGGLSQSTYANWANWTAQYTNVTKEDLVRKAREAATKTNFIAPNPHPDYDENGMGMGYYTNYDVVQAMEELAEQQNDNLGNDLASRDGRVMLRGRPVNWVPFLDSDTGDPFYGINWGVFKITCLEGWFLRESPPRPAPNQHNVIQVHVDLTWNTVCHDRRSNFLITL